MAAKYATTAELAERWLCSPDYGPDDYPGGQAQRREPRRVENPLGRGLPLRKGARKGRHRDAAATASWVCSLIKEYSKKKGMSTMAGYQNIYQAAREGCVFDAGSRSGAPWVVRA